MQDFMTYEEFCKNVKKGIFTDLGNCPVTPLLIQLQGKWKTQILYELCIYDTVRFGVLKKDLQGIKADHSGGKGTGSGSGRCGGA